jgi:hypothetical protein
MILKLKENRTVMIFEDKIIQCIQNFNNIDKPDYTRSEINYYADFIELFALLKKEGGVSLGDVQDRFFGIKEYPDSETRDEDESFLNTVFNIISERMSLYADDYPFEYINNKSLLLKQDLSVKNKLYLSLLIASQLDIFNSFKAELTTDFERISYTVLKEFLPAKAVVKEFGRNTQYQGNARTKIRQLANDLDLQVDDYELSHVSERNTQDRGLDIVCWLPFKDRCGNKIILLCQCACGKEYESKQHDTRRFENYLRFYKTKPQHTLFIPYSLINTQERKFYHSDYIEQDYLIFERKRILEYHNDNSIEDSEAFKIIETCIASCR